MKRYIKSNRDDEYFGQIAYDKYGDMILSKLNGKKISKRRDRAEEPGGLIYEAKQLGIDLWDLLEALEGMCHNGTAREIDDSTYLVGDIRSCINSATNSCNISGKPVFGDSISDEEVYKVSSYFDRNFIGLSDSKEFEGYEESLDYAFDQVSIGAYVMWEDLVSGKRRYFSPDQMSQSYEDYGDVSSINDAEIFRR